MRIRFLILISLLLLSPSARSWPLTAVSIEHHCAKVLGALVPKNPTIKAYTARLAEMFANVIQYRMNLRYETFVHGEPGQSVTFRIGKKIGGGLFGLVYHVEIVSFEPGAIAAHPDLFENGKPRPALVMKIPRLANGFLEPFNISATNALLTERNDVRRITTALTELGRPQIPGADILADARRETTVLEGLPYLIKPLLPKCCGVSDLGKMNDGKLTQEQRDKLKVIYESADMLYRQKGIVLDLKPNNLLWNPDAREWQMYELTDAPHLKDAFVARGFNNYLTLFENTMRIASRGH